MKGERLFEILGLIDDKLIDEAENKRKFAPNTRWLKWTAAIACLLILFSSGVWYILANNNFTRRAGGGGMGHKEGSTFMHYAGPILPLNIVGDIDGITAKRNTLLDFSAYTENKKDLWVTDKYILFNNTPKDKKIDVFYPYISSISDSNWNTPTLKQSNYDIQPTLIVGEYTGGFTGAYGMNGPNSSTHNLEDIKSWEGYKALLENGKYFELALSDSAFMEKQVTVYSFYDTSYPKEYSAATLAIDFDLPQGTRVITYGINGLSYEGGNSHRQYDFFVPNNDNPKIIFIGDAPSKYRLQGYEDGGCKKRIPEVMGKVKIETLPLSKVLKDCINIYRTKNDYLINSSPLVTDNTLFRAVTSMFQYTIIGDKPKDRYGWMRLDDLIGESFNMKRIMYLKAQITIPRGGSVELESKFLKGSSYDFYCASSTNRKSITGYDMVTYLGSNLKFIQQTASLKLPESYEIVSQNFNFNIKKNVQEVQLDINSEHYYLEIREKKN